MPTPRMVPQADPAAGHVITALFVACSGTLSPAVVMAFHPLDPTIASRTYAVPLTSTSEVPSFLVGMVVSSATYSDVGAVGIALPLSQFKIKSERYFDFCKDMGAPQGVGLRRTGGGARPAY